MADFVSNFWSWFIIVPVLVGILALFYLSMAQSRDERKGGKAEPMGHVWDENLAELNNPLPKWWLNLFYITLVFGLIYLALYPGLGRYQGYLKWTQEGQYEKEVKQADETYGPIYEAYLKRDLVDLSKDPEAMKTATRLFVNNCTICHGSDARGGKGFPNLTDNDWLYGGAPETIEQTILHGRNGVMPAWKGVLGQTGVFNVSEYVLSLSGHKADPNVAAAGKAKFEQLCAACHGKDGKGGQAVGAPNLTDNTWLYGGSQETVLKTISDGRQGHMPAHEEFLGKGKVHLLAAYVYSLSHQSEDRLLKGQVR